MTARLPKPGGDTGTWGTILNAFLEVSLNGDGSLKTSAVNIAGGELTSHKGAASGYAGLNGGGTVPSSQLGSGTASSSTFLRGDGTWATPAGSGITLASDTDVSITSPSNNQVLTYDSTSSQWTNQAVPAAPVTSVAGRTGSVTLSESDIANLSNDLSTLNTTLSSKLSASNNLSDVSSASSARTNLGLGTAATANIGTTGGTVAAGNDSRITGALQSGTAAGGDLSGTLPDPSVTSTSLTTPLPVNQGGSGAGTLTGVLKGNGTAAVTGAATLNDVGAPTGDFSLANHKLTNVTDPAAAQDAATKNYVDGIAQGLDAKPSVSALGTSNVSLSGTQTIDGVALIAGNRGLLIGQTNPVENGIWVVASGSWTRPADFSSGSSQLGTYVFVTGGTTNADTGWVLTTGNPIIVDTDPQSWTQFSSSGAITAGTGLTKTGNQIALTNPVDITLGGTGQQTQQAAINALTLATGNANKYLRSDGTNAAFDTIHTADLPVASTSAQGIVQLSGDLGGTTTSPSVLKIHGTTVSNTPTGSGQVLTSTGTSVAGWTAPLVSSVNGKTGTVSLATGDLTDASITSPSDGQVLTYSATDTKWENKTLTLAESNITNLVSDLNATEKTANKGIASGYAPLDGTTKVPIANLPTGTTSSTVMIGNQAAGGDLSGTLPSPTVAKIKNVSVSGTPSSGQVLIASSSSAASWSTPPYVSVVSPSGDTTGVTDLANINAALTGFPRKKAFLGPGTFYINGPITPQNNTYLQGSGILTTVIQQNTTSTAFSGNAMYQAALSATISDLTLQGQTATTASNPQADGIYITQNGNFISGVTVRNVRFTDINGWCVHQYDDGTHGEPTGCQYDGLRDGGGNAGGMGFFGASRSLGMVVKNCTLNANGGTSTTLDGLYIQDGFDLEFINSYFGSGGTSTGHAWHLYGHCSNGRFVMTEIGGPAASTAGTGMSGIKIEDGPNGHASILQFVGLTVQQYDNAINIQGSCSDISFTECEFNSCESDGVVVNTSGNHIRFINCRWSTVATYANNGLKASGTNYDLNWSGTGTGDVLDCVFASSIVATGNAGVQASVNVAAGQQVIFSNAKFAGSGSSSSNWFTNTPSAAMVISGGSFNFASGLTIASTNPAWSPTDSGLASWTFDPASAGQNTFQLATGGTGYGTAFQIRQTTTISKFYCVIQTIGSGLTTSQCFGAVYNATGTLLGNTADQSTNWGTTGLNGAAAGAITLTVASGQSLTLAPGKYWAAVFYNGTTGPKFFSAAPSPYFTAVNAGLTGSSARAATLFTGATTTVPTSAIFTAGGEALWFAVA